MKIQGKKYEVMKTAMTTLIEHLRSRGNLQKVLNAHESKTFLLWNLWGAVSFQLLNDDNHPAFTRLHNLERIVPYNPEFDAYSDGVNDDHIETALKHIGSNLGII